MALSSLFGLGVGFWIWIWIGGVGSGSVVNEFAQAVCAQLKIHSRPRLVVARKLNHTIRNKGSHYAELCIIEYVKHYLWA